MGLAVRDRKNKVTGRCIHQETGQWKRKTTTGTAKGHEGGCTCVEVLYRGGK